MELLLLDPESDRLVASYVWFWAKFRENKLILGIYGANHRGRSFCDPLTPTTLGQVGARDRPYLISRKKILMHFP